MKTIPAILALLLLATAAMAETPAREPFPSDFEPHPCAPTDLCSSFDRIAIMRDAGTYRAEYVSHKWLRANWKELLAAIQPACAKLSSCIATPGNESLFCTDLLRNEFLATANHLPEGSDDRRQWLYSVMAYFLGRIPVAREAHKPAQECAAQQTSGERKLEVWMEPDRIGDDYDGKLTVYAIDAETRVPVMAEVSVDSDENVRPIDVFSGKSLTTYPLLWTRALKRVPNADGHRDVVLPTVTVRAKGYETVTFPMPLEVPKMVVEMNPPAERLIRGRNTVTITARDAATGEPVEARVMGGDRVLGETNKPFVLDLSSGKRPEIWVTSLFDRYSDVVVAPAEK